MVKHQILSTILCGTMLLSSLSMSGFSELPSDTENVQAEPVDQVEEPTAAVKIEGSGWISTAEPTDETEELVIEGEVGDIFVSGDLIFEIVSNDEVEEMTSAPVSRASRVVWSVPLDGDTLSKGIRLTDDYGYAKVWVQNKGSSGIKFTITKDKPTGSVISGSEVTIASNTSTSIYSTNKWGAGVYFANYTSGKANMAGQTACRIASTQHELDV